MSTDRAPTGIVVDEEGVWITGYGGPRHGIEWAELCEIAMHRLDLMTEVVTVVSLEFSCGEYVELHSDVAGFDEAIAAIDARLKLDPRAVAAFGAQGADADPVVVWKKP